MIKETIYTLLSSVGIVSPNVMRQTQSNPYMVYYLVSNTPSKRKDGVSRLDVMRLQVSIYAYAAMSAETLYESLRTALDGYASGNIQHISYDSHRDMYDESGELNGISVDFIIRVKR